MCPLTKCVLSASVHYAERCSVAQLRNLEVICDVIKHKNKDRLELASFRKGKQL